MARYNALPGIGERIDKPTRGQQLLINAAEELKGNHPTGTVNVLEGDQRRLSVSGV